MFHYFINQKAGEVCHDIKDMVITHFVLSLEEKGYKVAERWEEYIHTDIALYSLGCSTFTFCVSLSR